MPDHDVSRPMGRYLWDPTTDRWSWDRGMFELHGYREGAVDVTCELVLEHKDDAHRARAAAMLEAAARGDRKFSNYHGIVDADGCHRTVLTVGESLVDTSRSARPRRFARGFMVDVTRDDQDSTLLALTRARESTASIQQSVGLLMGSLGLTEDAAFAVLRRMSQHHNVKVRDLARRFMSSAASTAADSPRDLSQLLLDQAAALAAERARRAQ